MKKWIWQNKLILVGGLIGAVAGFLYWKYRGCINSCTITSNPRNSAIYFAVLGALVFGMFKKETYANKE
jgi:hypothetical protein